MSVLDELRFVGQIATGALAAPAAGFIGLGSLLRGQGSEETARLIREAEETLTMDAPGPSVIRDQFAPLGELAGAVSEGYDEYIGNPLTDALGAPGAALASFGKGLGAVAPAPGAAGAAGALTRAARGPEIRPLSTEGYGPIREAAGRGQATLERLGSAVEEMAPGVTYYNPPRGSGVDSTKLGKASGIARAARKAAERGETVGDLTDLVRGSFEVPTPAMADQVVNLLRDRGLGDVIDEGWLPRPDAGYIDRPVKINTPEGLSYEVQLHVPGMMNTKFGAGHDIYEAARQTRDPGVLARLNEQSRRVYQEGVYSGLGPAWAGVLAGLQ